MRVAIPQDQTPEANPPTRVAPRQEGSCGRKPMTPPTRSRRACGSRMRCLPGSHGRKSVARLKALVAATVLSVPHLFLPATPAAAACETSGRFGHLVADLLPAGALVSQVTWVGLRIDGWWSLEAEEGAGSADLPGGRWGGWSPDRFARLADDGSAWTGAREMTVRGLVLVRSFLSMAGDSVAPGGWWADWEPAAPMRSAVEHVSRGGEPGGSFGADCERGLLPAPVEPSYGIGDGGSPGAALGLGPGGSRDLGKASFAHRRAYPGNRIDWNGHDRAALSGLCFESEGRGGC